jgi:hypothetical protein
MHVGAQSGEEAFDVADGLAAGGTWPNQDLGEHGCGHDEGVVASDLRQCPDDRRMARRNRATRALTWKSFAR